jgi:AcrR family transcriptional regulator
LFFVTLRFVALLGRCWPIGKLNGQNRSSRQGILILTGNSTGNSSMRDRILEGAERCFERQGIQKTTLSHIAQEAGVSRVSVYRQFPDREALIYQTNLHILKQRWRRIADHAAHISDPVEWLLEVLLLNQRHFEQDSIEHHYWEDTIVRETMDIALSKEGLECIAIHLRNLMARSNSKVSCNMSIDELAEWLHWQTFIIFNYRGRYRKSEELWRDYLAPLVHGGIFS